MESLDDIIDSCISQIQTTHGLIPIFAEMWANKSPFTKDEIETAMKDRVSFDDNHVIESVQQVSKSDDVGTPKLVKKPLVKFDKTIELPKINTKNWGLSRNQHYRKMSILTDIRRLLLSKQGQGFTKTKILKWLGKDNSHWRDKITDWLNEMVKDGIILRIDNKYYSPQARVESREKMLHRLVFESLENRPLSTTAIANLVGCGGGGNRSKLRGAIQDLHNDGYIRLEGIRWRWIR